MKIFAVGGKAFVTGFVLAGVNGEYVSSPEEAMKKIEELSSNPEVGLIIVSDEIAKPLREKISLLKTRKPVPLIYEVPGPGSKPEKIEYRKMLRQILGV